MLSYRPLIITSGIPVLAATAALTVSTAIAAADSNDDAYFAQIQKLGISVSQNVAVNAGHEICSNLKEGTSADQIISSLMTETNPPLTLDQATGAFRAAKQHYCS